MKLTRCVALLVLPAALAILAFGQSRTLPLNSSDALTLHNTVAAPVTYNGKAALRLTADPKAGRPATQRAGGGPAAREANRLDHLAIVDGVTFQNGVIEVDLAGEPAPGASGGARGFVGVAFRVQPDNRTYDCFYLRPTNGRAEDQERRNHTAQYISHPEHTWFSLREKTPSRYESYVDIEPAKWIHVKIDVQGEKARLYVNGNEQPTLIVNDVKSGASRSGGLALWFEGSTVAHYANLKITPR